MKILSFGEIIWDVYPEYNVIGGAPLNFAGHCAMGGHDAFMLSAVGNDELGDKALSALGEFGVKSEFVIKNNKKTGQCTVTLDERGVPSYNVLTDVAYDNIAGVDTEKINREHFDAFYFGTLAQRNAMSRATLEMILSECSFGEIFCDLNLRDGCYDEKSVKNCLENATVLKFSEEEAPRLDIYGFWHKMCADNIINALFSAYKQIKVILFTKGGEGACVYTRDGKAYEIPAVGDKVVSTVGAGDSFGAAWLGRYLSGDGERVAAEVASRVSGYVVSVVEALPKYRIDGFLNEVKA